MSTAKQYKTIGEDLWKSRTEKIVRLYNLERNDSDVETRMQSYSPWHMGR